MEDFNDGDHTAGTANLGKRWVAGTIIKDCAFQIIVFIRSFRQNMLAI